MTGPDRRTTQVSVTWLGHATAAIDIALPGRHAVRLLTDPALGATVGPLARLGPTPLVRHWAGADAVLLSHLHHDHADLPSLRRLRGVPVLTARANVQWLARRGLLDTADTGPIPPMPPNPAVPLIRLGPAGPAGPDDAWSLVAEGIEVRLVRAEHASRPMPHRPNHANGFLIRGGGAVIWFAGDTSLHPEVDLLAEQAGAPVDLALVPIGGWGPRLSPGHLGPVQAAEAVARAGAGHVVPLHHGTLYPKGWPANRRAWMHAPLAEFVDVLPRWSGALLHPLVTGESVTVEVPTVAESAPGRGGGR